MTKPSLFISTTDFPTLKNDATATASGVVAGSLTITGSGFITNFGDLTVGTLGSLARGRIASTKNNNNFYLGQTILFDRVGTAAGSAAPYSISAFMFRIAPTTLRIQIYISNPYSTTLTCEAGDETISFHVNTFVPPFA